MTVTEDRIRSLREHGLSEYAARAYLALLQLGVSEARDIARVGAVPVPKVHATLALLHERGLVQIIPQNPRRFAPVPFQRYVDRQRREHLARAQELERSRERLASQFRILGEGDVGDRGGITLVRGRRSLLTHIRDVADGEGKSPLFYLGTRGDAESGRLALALRGDAPGVRVVLPVAPDEREGWPSDIRVAPWSGERAGAAVALLVGRSQAVLAHFVPDNDELRRGDDMGVVLDRPAFVEALRAMAMATWEQAEEAPGLATGDGSADDGGMPA